MSQRYPEMKDPFDQGGLRRGEDRELAEVADKRAEQTERKLVREIEEEEASADRAGQVDPPPELSPAEKRERERDERLSRVEQGQGKAEEERRFAREPSSFRRRVESSEQHRRREALRLLRTDKDAKRQSERNREHEKRCARQSKVLEGRIADLEARARAEKERHREAVAEGGRAHLEASEKLAALNRSLAPDESTEDRLRSLELVA
jgi:hypothetical protein